MAFTPEHGALIVDSQYENEEQQFLEEIHLAKNNYTGPDNNSSNNSDQGSVGLYGREHSQPPVKTFTRLRGIKTEPMDYDEQTCSENGRSGQSFGEDNASISESSQMDYYSANQQFVARSPRNVRCYDDASYSGLETGNQYGEGSSEVGTDQMAQEPGPIREDAEERQDSGRNGFESLEVARAAWTPPAFRTNRPPCTVDWRHPRVRDVLRDYRNSKITSREAVELITKISGSAVSVTTVRVKCRMLDELDAQNVEGGAESRCSSEIGGSDGADTSQSLRENGRFKCLQNNTVKPLIPGVNAPIVAPPNSPYYLSFSRRFKQTSLTVPLNPDEVRLYRHASHSRSGRTIHFRCSRCDTLHQTYKSGEIARIKMVDGVVVSQLYPVHHERCKPIRLVEARAKEIERRCRKDIIMGMNPKEAWKKGRKAAISEATAAGFPVYGPGSILSAFPEWDKVKALFGALRARYIRRQMYLKQRMGGKKNFDNDERKVETADFDTSEVTRPKRPWMMQAGAYSNAARHDDGTSTSGLENVAVSEGEEIVGNDFELDDFEEESLSNFMQNAGKVVSCNQVNSGAAAATNSSMMPKIAPNGFTLTPSAAISEAAVTGDIVRERHGTAGSDNSRIAYEVQEVERAIARANMQRTQNSPEQISRAPILSPTRSSPASSVFSAVASVEGTSAEQRARHSRSTSRKRKRIEDAKISEEYITFVSPAGVLPCARKKRNYSEREAQHKLREIEQAIAQYNALCNNKIAAIHVSRDGDLKMHGSKYIIDSCLHSSVVRNLKNKWRDKEAVDEEGVDDDELISIPLVRCLSNLEINLAKSTEVRAMLNKFLDIMHYPWKPWFDKVHCPDYWPATVPFYDPRTDLLSLSNLSQRKETDKHSIVDLEKDILKYAYKHYTSFMEYHFQLSGPNYDEDSRNTVADSDAGVLQQSTAAASTIPVQSKSSSVAEVTQAQMSRGMETAEVQPKESVSQESTIPPGPSAAVLESSPAGEGVEQCSDAGMPVVDVPPCSSTTSAPVLSSDKILEGQLALFRNSVLRIRYDTMGADVRTILESVIKIQNHSTCRALVLFVDERNKLTLAGDKTLISAFLSSNVPQCLPPAMDCSFDNQAISLPLLQLYEDAMVDQMTEDRALDLLEDLMLHVNFPWSDPYEGSQPECWPPEIPFCPPWSNDGRGILNRRIGANTPGQAAKVILKSVRWFFSELLLEKLKLEDGLKKIAPMLAELAQNLLQERGSAMQTPVPRSASVQKISPFRVPCQVVRRSPSQRSYTSQLRSSPYHTATSQELRMYAQPPVLPPAPELRTEFTSQELPYRDYSGPLSPSQHSVSSQETVPFRLPPHLAAQQYAKATQQAYVAQTYESRAESYIMSDDRSVATMTPAESYVPQEAPVEDPSAVVRVRPEDLGASQDFRIPHIPSQQMRSSEDRTASWTSHHSPSVTTGSRSTRSRRSSIYHRGVRPESHGSVENALSQQFIAGDHRFQVPAAYNKPSAVRLHSRQRYHVPVAPLAAAPQRGHYLTEEDPAAAARFQSEGSAFGTVSPHSTYSSEHPGSSRATDLQGPPCTGEAVRSQLPPQETQPTQEFVAPQNPPQEQQGEQQGQLSAQYAQSAQVADEGFLRVLCSCSLGTDLDARDCLRCDRCHRYFHDKCLPLRRKSRRYLCTSCLAERSLNN